ncbi:MAG: flagellar basal body-associated FliL family protein [Hyphomicrobiales bacterium]|nr:flagellar basal body-associated FliL family protein [Hyphomicrobiales bacterium]MCP5373505.1 flagellar basal body-associated FliL family protein [Hyphomicrobiales bacterium]
MKKLVILVVLVLVLAGAGGAALFFLKLGPFAPPPGAKSAAAPAPKPDPPRFIPMSAMSVPIFQGDRVVATIQFEIVLETRDPEVEYAVKKDQVRLKDAFLRDLHGFMPRLLRDADNIDLLVLKKRLKMVADRTLGEGKISDVLIQSVTQQGG